MNIKLESKDYVLTLELSLREVRLLRAIFGKILGSTKGPRGLTDKLYHALPAVPEPAFSRCHNAIEGNLRLPDTWEAFE
jgi:hypothetical protein